MSMDIDVDMEMEQLLEDIPIGLILEDEETPTLVETEMDAGTEPPTNERGGATQAVASQLIQADGEGGKEGRRDDGHPCQGLPMLPTTVVDARASIFNVFVSSAKIVHPQHKTRMSLAINMFVCCVIRVWR